MIQSPAQISTVQTLPVPVSIHMLTRILAYFQKQTVKRLMGKHFIPLDHVRSIMKLCYPNHYDPEQIKSWHQDTNFLNSIALLLSSNLLLDDGPSIIPSPKAQHWLSLLSEARQSTLITGSQTEQFSHIQNQILNIAPPPAFQLYFIEPPTAYQTLQSPDQSPFTIPANHIPDWLWFDLYQIADWNTDSHHFVLNQESVSKAVSNHFSLKHIKNLIEGATKAQLKPCQQAQLARWGDHGQTYSLQQAMVLSVRKPADLNPIFKNKKLKQAITDQFSPRHIAIRPKQIPAIQKELTRLGHHLPQPQLAQPRPFNNSEWSWLGLRVLAELRQFAPNTPTPSGALLDQLASQLPLETHSDLETQASKIIQSIRQAIQGKDQFFPAQTDPPEEWTIIIEEAIEKETTVQLCYQSLGDVSFRTRIVWPHRIWHTASLTYFSGWCECRFAYATNQRLVLSQLACPLRYSFQLVRIINPHYTLADCPMQVGHTV